MESLDEKIQRVTTLQIFGMFKVNIIKTKWQNQHRAPYPQTDTGTF